MSTTTITVSREIYDQLKRKGKKGESFDKILRRFLFKEGINPPSPPQPPTDFAAEERRAMVERTYDPNIFAGIEKASKGERKRRKKLHRKQADDRFDTIVKGKILKRQKKVFEDFLRLKGMMER